MDDVGGKEVGGAGSGRCVVLGGWGGGGWGGGDFHTCDRLKKRSERWMVNKICRTFSANARYKTS